MSSTGIVWSRTKNGLNSEVKKRAAATNDVSRERKNLLVVDRHHIDIYWIHEVSLHDHLYSPCIEHGGQNDFRNNPFRCREFAFVHCIEIKFVFYFLVFFFFGRSDERDGHSCTILLSILINILLFFCLFVFPFLAFKMFIQYKNVFVRLKICRR